MNIAIVSDAIYPYNKGGKEKRIYEISTKLVKLGHDVHIYCMKWWKEKETHRIENGVHLHAISRYYPLYSGNRRSIKEAILFSLSCFKLIKENFDVIDVDHMPHLVLFPLKIVCLLKKKKIIVTWNEVWGKKYWITYMGIPGNIAYIIERLSVLMADEIISISAHTTKKLRNILHYRKNIKTIFMGIDMVNIKKIKASKNKSDVIFAGRLLKHKNVDVLINAIKIINKKIPNISCLIIGEGPEKENLVKQVNKLNLKKNIKFLDFLPLHKDLYSLMKSSKVFVLPSTREGFGIVALEANACNIPFITTNHRDNAAKDLILEGKNGYIVNLKEKAIAEKIIQYISIHKTTDQYSEYVKNYDWVNITNQIEETYQI